MAASTDERSALCRGPVVAARRVEVRDDGRLREHPQRVVRGGWRVRYRGACDARAARHRGQLCQHDANCANAAPMSMSMSMSMCILLLSLRLPFCALFPPLPPLLSLVYIVIIILYIYSSRCPCHEVATGAGQARRRYQRPTIQDQQLVGGGSHASTNMCVISHNDPGRDALTLTRGGRRGHAHTRN